MLGKLLGKVLALPLRVVNIPLKVAQAGMNNICGERFDPKRELTVLDSIAETVEDTCESALGGDA